MATPLLTTKLFIPPAPRQVVSRPALITQLNEALHCKLTLVSAPAGFGKTTAVSEWLHHGKESKEFQAAWVSLDAGDNDPYRFLAYVVGALQTIAPTVGQQSMAALQGPQPLPIESILTLLLNELTAVSTATILVLDDYHLLDSREIDTAVPFLLEQAPPHIHLIIITREDPILPLAKYRVRGQLNELRALNLRFSRAEADMFLNQIMNLDLSATEIAALAERTEGWIAGLQLAALALQGQGQALTQQENDQFIQSFTGSHRFVLDYLMEEVFSQQSEEIQNFLLYTSILERMSGSLCDAVLGHKARLHSSGQAILEQLEQANLFITPLDNERRWYRYHHLFGELLRQRLATILPEDGDELATYHLRASSWYEAEDFWFDAFHHATMAQDIARAERLIEGDGGMPMYFQATMPIQNWLASLPLSVLDARPSLWVIYASVLLISGELSETEEKLQAAERVLGDQLANEDSKDIYGRIAAIRATLAVVHNQPDQIMVHAQNALANLAPTTFSSRTTAVWALGFAHHLQGNRIAAAQALTKAIAMSKTTDNRLINITASTSLGKIQEADTQLLLAHDSYQYVLQLAGDPPQAVACEAYLGLANIHYQWNNLEAARQHAEQGRQLAQQIERIDTYAICEVTLARLHLAAGNVRVALTLLTTAERFMRQHQFQHRMAELIAVQFRALLQLGDVDTAVHLAKTCDLPIIKARAQLAQNNPSQALTILAQWRQEMEARGWQDEILQAIILQAVAYDANGESEKAAQHLITALQLAQKEGFIRLFVDEGRPMAELLRELKKDGLHFSPIGDVVLLNEYIQQLLDAFDDQIEDASLSDGQPVFEPLTEREIEVLELVASGLTNREIGERLHLTLNTVKVHTRNIYSKLDVHTRTQAVAKARELRILSSP